MKIHDRKGFLLGCVCVLPIIYEAKHFSGSRSLIWIVYFAVVGLGALCAALNPKKDQNTKS